MADSFSKKERAKKKAKKKQEKLERKKRRAQEGPKPVEIMYVDADGNFTSEKPDPADREEINVEDIQIGIPRQEDIEDEPIKKGTVKFFDLDKGYGFITGQGSHESYFVHANNLIDPIKDHDKVSFEVEMGPKGPVAINVTLVK